MLLSPEVRETIFLNRKNALALHGGKYSTLLEFGIKPYKNFSTYEFRK